MYTLFKLKYEVKTITLLKNSNQELKILCVKNNDEIFLDKLHCIPMYNNFKTFIVTI